MTRDERLRAARRAMTVAIRDQAFEAWVKAKVRELEILLYTADGTESKGGLAALVAQPKRKK